MKRFVVIDMDTFTAQETITATDGITAFRLFCQNVCGVYVSYVNGVYIMRTKRGNLREYKVQEIGGMKR